MGEQIDSLDLLSLRYSMQSSPKLMGVENMMTNLLQTATVANQDTESLRSADTDSLYVLIASLLLALVAFVILMRLRWK